MGGAPAVRALSTPINIIKRYLSRRHELRRPTFPHSPSAHIVQLDDMSRSSEVILQTVVSLALRSPFETACFSINECRSRSSRIHSCS
jgi:hypothetical protein